MNGPVETDSGFHIIARFEWRVYYHGRLSTLHYIFEYFDSDNNKMISMQEIHDVNFYYIII